LFRLLHSAGQADTVREADYALSTARLLQTPLLSGIAGVGGVVVTALAAKLTGGAVPTLSKSFDLGAQPYKLLLAAVFAFTPTLLISRLQGDAEKSKQDLQGSQSAGGRRKPSSARIVATVRPRPPAVACFSRAGPANRHELTEPSLEPSGQVVQLTRAIQCASRIVAGEAELDDRRHELGLHRIALGQQPADAKQGKALLCLRERAPTVHSPLPRAHLCREAYPWLRFVKHARRPNQCGLSRSRQRLAPPPSCR
jgi:hypothetical protein